MFRGFYGEKCDRMCIPTPDRHYSCSTQGQKICHEGWTGEECGKSELLCVEGIDEEYSEIDACTSNPCANDGICRVEGVFEFSCTCQNGFEGRQCETARYTNQVIQ